MAESQTTSSRCSEAVSQSRSDWSEIDGDLSEEFKPLSKGEARHVARKAALPSPWLILAWQASVGLLLAIALAVLDDRAGVFESALFGCFAVVVPGAVFARGLQRQNGLVQSGAVLLGFFVWEMVKIVLVLLLLAAAPVLILNLNWLALLAGLVVTLKVSWFVLMWRSRVSDES